MGRTSRIIGYFLAVLSLCGVGFWVFIRHAGKGAPHLADQSTEGQKDADNIANQKGSDTTETPNSAPVFRYQPGGGGRVAEYLQEMDLLAAEVYEINEDELWDHSTELAKIVEWAGETPGYGNYTLARRAQDLGSVTLSRLLVEYGLETEDASNILAQLQSWELDPRWRAVALDQEFETDVFSRSISQMDKHEREDGLWKIWENMKDAARLLDEEGEGFHSIAEQKLAEVATMGIPRDIFEEIRPVLLEEVRSTKPATSTEHWNRRYLSCIADSANPDSLRRVRCLIEYKELVGHYPTEATPTKEGRSTGNLTDTDRAFRIELIKLNTSLRRFSTASLASETYDMVKAGEFVDEDTSRRGSAPP